MKHMNNNVGIMISKQSKLFWKHVFLSKNITDVNYMASSGLLGGGMLAPLFVGEKNNTSNLNMDVVKKISSELKLEYYADSIVENTPCYYPIDLLDYIYAVLHSLQYRETYEELLKQNFPRVPYPTDKEMFWKMVKLGGEIRKLHLMESPLLDTLITRFPLNGSNEVEKITRKENRVYINKTQYFEGVSDLAWNFYIGGYQPLQKWLKDRKGRMLSDEDIIHYQKIVVALTETDRLMKEIDEVFVFGEEVIAND